MSTKKKRSAKTSPKAKLKAAPKAEPKAEPKVAPKATPKATPKAEPTAEPKAEGLDKNGGRRGCSKTPRSALHTAFGEVCLAYGRKETTDKQEPGSWYLTLSKLQHGWRIEQIGPDGSSSVPFGPAAHQSKEMLAVMGQLVKATHVAPRRGAGAQ